MLNGKNRVRMRIRQKCLFYSILFNIILEVLASVTRRRKQNRSILVTKQIGREDLKLYLFTDHMKKKKVLGNFR